MFAVSEYQIVQHLEKYSDLKALFHYNETISHKQLYRIAVYHQNDERIKSHIYLTLLAYQMVNTIRYMLKQAGIYHSWSTILKMIHTQRMTTVSLSSETKTIELRTPTQANGEQKQIYKACNCKATKPIVKKYVVYH